VQQQERERREDQQRGAVAATGSDDEQRDDAAGDQRERVADDPQADPAGAVEEARQQDPRAAGPGEEVRTGLDDGGLDAAGGVRRRGCGELCRRRLRTGVGAGTRSDAVLSVIRPAILRPNSRTARQLPPIAPWHVLAPGREPPLCDKAHTAEGWVRNEPVSHR
jgi:hypothetical protein